MYSRAHIGITFAVIAFLIGATTRQAADAAPITFTSKAAFLAATGATNATGALPNLGSQGLGPVSVGSITYTAGPGASDLIFGGGTEWTTRLPGIDLAISGVENVNFQTASGVGSLGFDFVEPQTDPNVNAAFVDSTFSVSLFNGLVPVGTFAFNAPNDTAAFFGVQSDVLFNRVEVREIVGDNENEFFGPIFTSTALVAAVPEPSTLSLLSLAALGFLLASRRRKT